MKAMCLVEMMDYGMERPMGCLLAVRSAMMKDAVMVRLMDYVMVRMKDAIKKPLPLEAPKQVSPTERLVLQ